MKSFNVLNASRIIEGVKDNSNRVVILEGLLLVRELLNTNDANKLDNLIDTGLIADYVRKISSTVQR